VRGEELASPTDAVGGRRDDAPLSIPGGSAAVVRVATLIFGP
jgi:hypothetical protein